METWLEDLCLIKVETYSICYLCHYTRAVVIYISNILVFLMHLYRSTGSSDNVIRKTLIYWKILLGDLPPQKPLKISQRKHTLSDIGDNNNRE